MRLVKELKSYNLPIRFGIDEDYAYFYTHMHVGFPRIFMIKTPKNNFDYIKLDEYTIKLGYKGKEVVLNSISEDLITVIFP